MGVGSSREIEEQLEAALSLLDAARAKQEHLKAECDNLQSRIASQSATLLKEEQAKAHGANYLVQQRDPLSKRVLFGLAVAAPLATHTLLKAVSIEVHDMYTLAQGLLLCVVIVLLLRFRRYRWRRIRPERIFRVRRDGRPSAEYNEPGSPRLNGSAADPPTVQVGSVEVAPSHLSALIASEVELDVLREIKDNLRRDPPPPALGGELLPTHEPLLDVQLIRFLKEHGPNAGKIERCYRNALEWRYKNLPKPIPSTEDPGAWLSSADMTNGEWAVQYAYLGLYCGRSKIGCPVKIERLGRYNLEALQKSDPDYRKKFNHFYLSLIEFLQQRLDHYTLAEGRLVQTYEIFDLQGLGYHILTRAVVDFAKDILLNFSTHYPSSFRKAVILNAPSFLPLFWSAIKVVLPKSVTAKVNILGADYYKTLTEELGEEALAWIESSNYDLSRAPHKPAAAAASSGGRADDEPLDGEPLIVEEESL